MRTLRNQVGQHLIHVPYVELESLQRGDILSRAMGDLEKIQFFFESSISDITITMLLGVVGLIINVIISWKLTLAIIATIPIIFLLNVISTKSLEALMMKQKKEVGKGNSSALNVLLHIDSVKAFNLEQLMSFRYFKQLKEIQGTEESIAKKKAILSFVQCFGSMIIYITLTVVGGLLIVNGELTPGNFLIVMMLISPIGAMAYQLQAFIFSYKECKTGAKRILEVLNLTMEEDTTDKVKFAPQDEACETMVELKDVSFSYHYLRDQKKEEHKVIEHMNLKIKKGQKVAIVGSSGCGKSTLLKLISTLYESTEGSVLIDGIPCTSSNIKQVREKLAVVLQENYLFPISIAENIRYGNSSVTQQEIIDAAKKVGIHDFICSLPKGYDTVLGEDGKTISGGQRQRICIARAYIKKPELLILDEPTAALDMESERIVEQSLEQLMEGKTTVTVAHRLSTVKNSDIIFCMDQGKIVEAGTHEELYARKGHYYQLYRIQEEMAKSA